MFFKKVDSRLKGHVAAELHAMAEGAGAASALVAPAVPAQGRIVKDLHVVGTGVAAPIDIAATCSGSGLQLTIPDTASDLDLDAALAVLAGEPRPLLVGAAGLAAALARQLVPECPALPATNLPAPLLLAVGSRDPITLGQLAVLKAAKGAMDLTDAGSPGPDAIGPAWLLQLRTAPDGLDGHEVGAAFAAAVEELLLARGVKTLFACGGETADAILGRLGAGVLTVEGEFLPGVPVASTIVNGRPLRVVTKSGGFGDPDTLLSVARAVEQDDGTARDE
ncbi:Putative inner membrane protein [Rubellimicrobium mesophilum DSM 19309]|uniref:Putative inner membrane protein n=2 Tax=Rubellimicrobium TaxID=295418 RepID=A0A017HI16_9RHOB|nr:Putative inner membrane protein [Rubellimicrobium mesophilum DSM 19309]